MLKQSAYSDLTEKNLHVSSRDNKYLLTIYDCDANNIRVAPLKTQQAK